MVRLDRVNRQILELLQKDGRISVSELARHIQRGESTIRERITSLEEGGYIQGYRAVVDEKQLGLHARAVVRGDCDPMRWNEISQALQAIPNVIRAYISTGPKSLRIELVADGVPALERIIAKKIGPLRIDNMETAIVLHELVPSRLPPLAGSMDGTHHPSDPSD